MGSPSRQQEGKKGNFRGILSFLPGPRPVSGRVTLPSIQSLLGPMMVSLALLLTLQLCLALSFRQRLSGVMKEMGSRARLPI